jgi:hypothetical protein
MTPEFVAAAIAKAELGQSKLSPEAIAVPGMTSPKIRHFLNNVGGADGINYLEIGIHKGATFVAANYGNKFLSSVAVDNWSQFCDAGTRDEFVRNADQFVGAYTLLDMDCFGIMPDQLPARVNMYLYDGDHTDDAQYRAVSHFYPHLDGQFLFMVDDWFTGARDGTRRAIRDLGLTTIFEAELSDGWWNGFFVALLRK